MTAGNGAGDRPPADRAPRGGWFTPALAPVLARRNVALPLAALGLLQVAAGFFHFHTFPCPVLYGIGLPCPGCGASRACGAVLRGNWQAWFRLHALAPCFLLAVLLFLLAAVLPRRQRDALAAGVERVERWTGLPTLVLVLIFVYWIARLVYAPLEFARSMRG